MTDTIDPDIVAALKIAFCYMPKAIEVNRYEYGDRYQKVISDIDRVREVLLGLGIDPDEVYAEINPDEDSSSCY